MAVTLQLSWSRASADLARRITMLAAVGRTFGSALRAHFMRAPAAEARVTPSRASAVVIARLQELDPIGEDFVH